MKRVLTYVASLLILLVLFVVFCFWLGLGRRPAQDPESWLARRQIFAAAPKETAEKKAELTTAETPKEEGGVEATSAEAATTGSTATAASKATEKNTGTTAKTSGATAAQASQAEPKPQLPALKKSLDDMLGALGGEYSYYFCDLKTGLEIQSEQSAQPAGGLINAAVMAATYAAVERGELGLDKTYTVPESYLSAGTGSIASGSERSFTLRQLLAYLMKDSDNSAANYLADQVGGREGVSLYMQQLGMKHGHMGRALGSPARSRTEDNLMSAADMGLLYRKLASGELCSAEASQEMLGLMHGSDTSHLGSKLPSGRIYNKSGVLSKLRNEALLYQGDKSFILVCMVNGADSESIQDCYARLGKAVYDQLP